ncbi:MAG: hypothetical protein M3203_01470 [Actinomycetota bacterium]|nr:hypothetical protein [Actinomycetota bacterium]
MDGSKKRRIYGAAALSATAIASLLGAQPAGAAPPAQPPGLQRACEATGPDSGRAWPIKWPGARCQVSNDGTYQWWVKVE